MWLGERITVVGATGARPGHFLLDITLINTTLRRPASSGPKPGHGHYFLDVFTDEDLG